jgi:hypothetical protein
LDKKHNILIGQGCRSTLTIEGGIPEISFDPATYVWTPPDGEIFGSYTHTLTLGKVKSPEDLDPNVWKKNSPQWFWKKGGMTSNVSGKASLILNGNVNSKIGDFSQNKRG